ncbi:hypothetical protein, partial [Terasakiella sp.]|uniref:hypothetical protein n=1 Tax=Terasakiella sp. TaxID=2034861 RepID=UPI003AA84AA3
MINLNFTDITKPAAHIPRKNPLDVFKAALTKQIDACRAAQSGKTYTLKRRRYTGSQEHFIDVPLRPWCWQHEGQYYVTLKYSSQAVAIKGNKSIVAG